MGDSKHGVAVFGSRIDVHAHFVPDFYRNALTSAGLSKPDGMPALPPWNVETALIAMERLGVKTAILSISSPGVHFGDDFEALQLARQVNEEAKRLVEQNQGRFGSFASVPLPDVGGAAKEAIYALDKLKADGIIIETNHAGIYLGDESLEPLWGELDQRSAVVLIHPTSPACSCSARLDRTFPHPIFEFMFETTRSVIDMVVAGVLKRRPRIRFIVPHAGGALSSLLERVDQSLPLVIKNGPPVQQTLAEAMRVLHFDLAGMPVPDLLESLLRYCDPAKLHYGSDFPFTPLETCARSLKTMETTPLLREADRRRLWSENSERLFSASRFISN